MEKMTCPRRMSDWGTWQRAENLDKWQPRGQDRVCSFCGSMHPDDLEKAIDRCLAGESVEISQSDKGYKVYVYRPEVPCADETLGTIKYHKYHNPADQSWLDRVGPKFTQAVALSWDNFMKLRNRTVE
jgi:hypothetical protein